MPDNTEQRLVTLIYSKLKSFKSLKCHEIILVCYLEEFALVSFRLCSNESGMLLTY